MRQWHHYGKASDTPHDHWKILPTSNQHVTAIIVYAKAYNHHTMWPCERSGSYFSSSKHRHKLGKNA